MIDTAIPSSVSATAFSTSTDQNRPRLVCDSACAQQPQPPAWHAGFLQLLPTIQRHARACFRRLPRDAREEAVAETVANALAAYARLVQLGKEDVAYATPLGRYAVARTRCGRWVGGRHNVRDVSSNVCRHRNGVVMQRIGFREYDKRTGDWQDVVVEDRRSGPADIAATRVDFKSWLATLSWRDRQVAEVLAVGESTRSAARMFRLSAGRVSQLRRELFEAWQRFHGEPVEGTALAVA